MAVTRVQYQFTALMDNVKLLYSLLKAINFQESATFCALEEGLKVTVEESKCVQVKAYIPSDNFNEYFLADSKEVEFKINLNVLTECLNIFGSGEDASLKLYYKGDGSPLILVLQHLNVDDVITECEIKTQEPEDLMNLENSNDKELAKIVLKAPQLADLFNNMERSSDTLQLTISPTQPYLSFITTEPQETRIDMVTLTDTIISFDCKAPGVDRTFSHTHVRLISKALLLSTKVLLKVYESGPLVLQLKLERDDKTHMFAEYHILPLAEQFLV